MWVGVCETQKEVIMLNKNSVFTKIEKKFSSWYYILPGEGKLLLASSFIYLVNLMLLYKNK